MAWLSATSPWARPVNTSLRASVARGSGCSKGPSLLRLRRASCAGSASGGAGGSRSGLVSVMGPTSSPLVWGPRGGLAARRIAEPRPLGVQCLLVPPPRQAPARGVADRAHEVCARTSDCLHRFDHGHARDGRDRILGHSGELGEAIPCLGEVVA